MCTNLLNNLDRLVCWPNDITAGSYNSKCRVVVPLATKKVSVEARKTQVWRSSGALICVVEPLVAIKDSFGFG